MKRAPSDGKAFFGKRMKLVLFGGDASFAEWFQMVVELLGHRIDAFVDTMHPLVGWIEINKVPDAVLLAEDCLTSNEDLLVPMIERLREVYPELHLVFINTRLPPHAIGILGLTEIHSLGIPIYTTTDQDDEVQCIVQLSTSKWPGFNPQHTFTASVVRDM